LATCFNMFWLAGREFIRGLRYHSTTRPVNRQEVLRWGSKFPIMESLGASVFRFSRLRLPKWENLVEFQGKSGCPVPT